MGTTWLLKTTVCVSDTKGYLESQDEPWTGGAGVTSHQYLMKLELEQEPTATQPNCPGLTSSL